MGRLFTTVRTLVTSGRYLIGQHATERLEERGILEWQVVDGIEQAVLLTEQPDASPNPAVEVRQMLADGTEVTVLWSHLVAVDLAKLVTVYFADE